MTGLEQSGNSKASDTSWARARGEAQVEIEFSDWRIVYFTMDSKIDSPLGGSQGCDSRMRKPISTCASYYYIIIDIPVWSVIFY